jgi:tripeptide aminopeptidase
VTPDPVELFVELAAIASPPGQERAVADQVAGFARKHGLEVHEDAAAAALRGTTGNLLLTLPAGRDGIPVFFCAHLDTVPVEGPVRPVLTSGAVRSDGRTILGADNKASAAAMLVALARIVEEERAHAGVELVLTPMEEAGCRGAKAFDPSVLRGHLGFVYDHEGPIGTYVRSAPSGHLLRLGFLGRAAHAGINPEYGRSAIEAAGRAISRIRLGRLDDGSTVNVGVIQGGTAHNVVAERCALTIDVRTRKQERTLQLIEEILATAQAAAAKCGCRVEAEAEEKYRDYRFEGDEPVVALARSALASLGTTAQPVDGGGGADASIFNARGIPCLNLGSGMRDVHTNGESITVADIHALVELTLAIVEAAAGR